ncbi:Odorant degrading enzyme CXE10, partial [Operophtera brumata]
HDFLDKQAVHGSEDCLYLNVYTPDLNPENLLPVMFWIHGGAFVSGSGNDDMYGPEFLVRHGVLLVTINYRLETFGFLCLDTPEIPGNAGMKDQVAALRWVNRNISQFGGNPENVTIFGESAGGASVGYHLVSPMTKGLFKRAIAQSGISACWWSYCATPKEKALALARKLGCYSEDDKVLYEFFKNQPSDTLINVKAPITLAQSIKTCYEPPFAIVNEKDFGGERYFYGECTHSNLASNIHEDVEVFTGYTTDDGLICMGIGSQLETKLLQMNTYYEEFVPKWIEMTCPILQQLDVGKKLKKLYFSEERIEASDWEQLVKFYSANYFLYDITQWINTIAGLNKNKVYLYMFSCVSDRNVQAKYVGLESLVKDKPVVCHGDDLMYLFNAKEICEKVDSTSNSFHLIDKVTKLWTNIAKYGNPTPDDSFGVKWSPYTLETQEYLDIGNELKVQADPNKEEMEFWEEIFKTYAPDFVFVLNGNNPNGFSVTSDDITYEIFGKGISETELNSFELQ